MADPDAGESALDSESGLTVELAKSEIRGELSATGADFREQLPGLEPERHVTDWGRSERIEGVVDRTLYRFLYHYWFRVEVEGIENVPATGGAMLVANHSGLLPSDGAMIAKAVREEHPRPRPVHLATEPRVTGVPALGMLVTKLGAVGSHPANLHRLLFDEDQLVLIFPEGREGVRKPLRERYRLRDFADGDFATQAARAGVPIVPVAVVGAEEAQPVFARVGSRRRLGRLPLPRLPQVPLAAGVPFPAKFKLRFLEPVATVADGEADEAHAPDLGREIRALIQENLLEMVATRQSIWLG